MSEVWGKNIQFSIFGESHGVAIGGVLSSVKAGKKLDFDKIDTEMKRRNHRAFYSTNRDEKDAYEILSGVNDGVTNGFPIAFSIRNSEHNSKDYPNLNKVPRPGHADYPACVKHNGFNDYRGGGHFSGRITAPLTLAGAIAKQYLDDIGVKITSHILSIGNISSNIHLPVEYDANLSYKLYSDEFPVIDDRVKDDMFSVISSAKEDGDSVGGIIECAVYNLPAGIGSPFFGSVESRLSELLYSIPAVKGVEFGTGFEITKLRGSEANDAYSIKDNRVVTLTNNNGGILGGITNGMPVVFRVAVKPTPSIFKTQQSVNLETKTNEKITLKGRHDACIVPRAVSVVEACAALGFLDMIYDN